LLGYNSRLDSVQAIVGNHLIKDMDWITEQRIKNANFLDERLSKNKQIRLPPRPKDMRLVYHLYIVFAENRDALLQHCIDKGIECKVHYPIPLYQQVGLKHLGYAPGAFPVTDRHTREIITFPAHQHLTPEQLDYMATTVDEFYARA
jgi:dTDP-4-amino-4,6-dideoxygalactose transaminase